MSNLTEQEQPMDMTAPDPADVPAEPVIALLVTPGGVAMVDGTAVPVPGGVDPRAAAAQVVVERSRSEGRPFRAILTDADGQRWRLLITADGPYQADTPIGVTPVVPAWPVVSISVTEAGEVRVDGTAVAVHPGADPYAAAVQAAAATARAIGRRVRAVATTPDGTQWPLIIHPRGTATADDDKSAGEAIGTQQLRGPLAAVKRHR